MYMRVREKFVPHFIESKTASFIGQDNLNAYCVLGMGVVTPVSSCNSTVDPYPLRVRV